jgi:hypothetical protein
MRLIRHEAQKDLFDNERGAIGLIAKVVFRVKIPQLKNRYVPIKMDISQVLLDSQ